MKSTGLPSVGLCVAAVLAALALGRVAGAQDNQLRGELVQFCEQKPAACINLLRDLMTDGVLDRDRDGVSDLADRCPGTPTAIARARALLLGQEFALATTRVLLQRTRELLVQGANGTQDGDTRWLLAGEIADLFDQLFEIANSETRGHFFFGGLRVDVPPFEMNGEFSPTTVPEIHYLGDHRVVELPVGSSGRLYPVTIPGDFLFFGDLDGDGSYPDSGAADLFGLLADAYAVFVNNDQAGIAGLIDVTSGALWHVTELHGQTTGLFYLTTQIAVEPEASEVDPAGCSLEQFCSGTEVKGRRGARTCVRSDFKNDEPLRSHPGDCRLVHRRHGDLKCVASW